MPLIETQPDALAQIYARSLFELAEGEGGRDRAEQILGELEDILELARQDRRFSEFLATRVIAASARDASLQRIFEKRASSLTLRFLRLLNAKDRLGHLPAITAAFDAMVQEAFGRVEVDLFTAEPLEEQARAAYRDRLARTLGKDIILHNYVEPAMLGGVKLRIGDRLIDDSLATKLGRMRDRLGTEGQASLRVRADRAIEDAN